MKNVKFDAYGYVEIDGVVYGDPEQAKLAMLGESATPDTTHAALREKIIEIAADVVRLKDENDKETGETDIVAPDYEESHEELPSFGNVRAFFDL